MKRFKLYTGLWWLPSNPEYRISGILELGEDNIFKLTTTEGPIPINKLFQPKGILTNEPIQIINGIAKDADSDADVQFTLNECRIVRYSGSQLIKTTYTVRYIAQEYHFSDLEAISASKVYIKPQFIDSWISKSGFDVAYDDATKFFNYNVKYRQPDPIPLFQDQELSIYVYFRANAPWQISNKAVLTQSVFINVEFNEVKPFSFVHGIMDKLKNWFAIAFSLSIRIVEFEISLGSNDTQGNIEDRAPIKFLVSDNDTYTLREDLHSRHMIISYSDLQNNSQAIFKNWFDKYEVLAPILKIYIDTIYNNNLYPQNQFLNYIFALEIYHRRTNFEARVIWDKHYERIEWIAEQIRFKNDKEFIKSWLKKKNPVKLETRLLDLIETRRSIIETFVSDIELFINKVISTRHHLVHLAPPKDFELILDGKNLQETISKLRILLQTIFLYEMGFAEEKISEQIKRPLQNRNYFIKPNV